VNDKTAGNPAPIEADWAKFRSELAHLADLFSDAPDEARRQFWAHRHLAEILNFLRFAGCGDVLAPTDRVFKALGGRQLGHGDPLLDFPEWRQGRKKRRSINETDFRAYAAATMQCFYISGLTLDKAAADTIRAVPLKEITVDQLKQWREEMMTELPAEHLGAFRYRSLTADLDDLSQAAAKAKAIQIARSMR
jgi:hypothetical protein